MFNRRRFLQSATAGGLGWAALCGSRLNQRVARAQDAPATPAPHAQLGMNLAGPADWNTELPFVDVFHLSREWISQEQGKSWGKGPHLKLDADGWITQLQPNCFAETPLCTIDGGHYPSGQYTVLYDGEGELNVSQAARVVSNSAGRMGIDVDPARGGFFLQVRSTNPKNYVRNLRVIMPGFEDSYHKNPWHPVFLKRWQGFSSLRFMDFMQTNNSKVKNWEDRARLEQATWTTQGIPVEMLCDLANRQQSAPWFCMPHLADDDYVRRFAEQVRELLSPELKVYVEYSNEVWNGQFEQNRYAGEQGRALKFADKPWEAAWKYTGYRSTQIFKIWEQVFGGTDRLVRVLASQAANPYVSEQVVQFQDAYQSADVLAIAPYVSLNVPKDEAEGIASGGLDALLDRVEQRSLPECIKWMHDQKQVADQFGLKLIAYEAGQHLVGVGGAENNEALTALLHQANQSQRMGQIYQQYYDAWEEAGGDLMCVFSSISGWSKWGSWGLMQYYDDKPANYPKFQATLDWAKAHGQPVNA